MSQNIATIDKIRAAFRALANSVELLGKEDAQYNIAMGISFAPARKLSADQLIEAVNKNRELSSQLNYNMAAGIGNDPMLNVNKEAAITALREFEKNLSNLPQDLGANMLLEFTVSNPHEQEIISNTQKSITAIQEATPEDVQKLRIAS